MPLVIRLNDTSDHGGTVISSASKTYVEGELVARIGDQHDCPIPGHGVTDIVEGSPDTYVEGMQVAREGDKADCGAALISSAVKTFVN